jgi:hypothetical protein
MVSTVKVSNITTPDGTGNVTFDRPLSGSGASLTSLPAANLTGTLPALDGSALTGVGVDGITSSANATAITISADEQVQMPLQPCFHVTAAAQTDQTGDGTVHLANLTQEVFDVGGNFASKQFTAPVTGKYLLCASLTWVAGQYGTTDSALVTLFTSNRTYVHYKEQSNHILDMDSINIAHVADMDALDIAKITWYISGGSKTADHAAGYYTMLSGILLA